MDFKRNMTRQEWWTFLTSVRGRVTRSTFNYFFLVMFLVSCILSVYDNYTLGFEAVADGKITFTHSLLSLLFVWPMIVITGRRLHDLGHSSWWQLFYSFVVFAVGVTLAAIFLAILQLKIVAVVTIILTVIAIFAFWIVLSCVKGQAGYNRFGADPLLEKGNV